MSPLEIRAVKLGALPIIRHFTDRLGLRRALEAYVPKDSREKVPASDTLYAILCNVILERFPLYKMGEWCQEREVLSPDLCGVLNDDRVGRALDRLFRSDRATLITDVVLRAIEEFELNMDRLHNDSTSLKFFGEYEQLRPKAARPKRGHSKDHRPDLKQLVFSLTICGDGAVPVFYRLWDGNVTDDSTHLTNWMALQRLTGTSKFTYVADSKLCVRAVMEFIDSQGGTFITVVPETRLEVGAFKNWIQSNTPTWVEVLRRKGRKKSAPDSVYLAFEDPRPSAEGFRIIWILSSEKQRIDEQKRSIAIEKTADALNALVGKTYRNCERLGKAIEAIFAEHRSERYFHYQITRQEKPRYRQESRGRPNNNTKYTKQIDTFYGVTWTHNQDEIRRLAKCDGLFPLMTNGKDMAATVLETYKYQPRLEKRHEQLKSVYDVAPVFLKNTERIEALICVYFLALLVTALIERQVRSAMKTSNIPSIPLYPEKRQCKHPTADKIFDLFRDCRLQTIMQGEKVLEVVPDSFSLTQNQLLDLLGMKTDAYFTTEYANR